ncbi:MAG: GNAT family N-acetyltransferase [Deltaproteobacteria bacterium]|nr:GNAT family N-acetyltransferase [Deltaproteobacteria bacterium]
MINFAVYRKFVNLNNGKRVLLRPLLEEDLTRLYNLFAEASEDDTKFLKDEVKRPDIVERWVSKLDYERVMPLVAYCDDRLVGDVAVYRGSKTIRHVGEIRIFLAKDFRGVGLGSKMLQEMFEVAKKADLMFLRAEVILDHAKVVKAFRRLGFDLRCTLDDYFMRRDGVTHDIALMIKRLNRPEEFTF